MQDSLPAGGLRLCRAGVEPAGSLREVSGHLIPLPRAFPGAIIVRFSRGATRALMSLSPPSGLRQSRRSHTTRDSAARFNGGSCSAMSVRISTSSASEKRRIKPGTDRTQDARNRVFLRPIVPIPLHAQGNSKTEKTRTGTSGNESRVHPRRSEYTRCSTCSRRHTRAGSGPGPHSRPSPTSSRTGHEQSQRPEQDPGADTPGRGPQRRSVAVTTSNLALTNPTSRPAARQDRGRSDEDTASRGGYRPRATARSAR